MASERSAKYRQEIQQNELASGVECNGTPMHICGLVAPEFLGYRRAPGRMAYNVRKAKEGPARPTILLDNGRFVGDVPSSNTPQDLKQICNYTSPTVAFDRLSRDYDQMASSKERSGNFPVSSNQRSKIVMLRTGGALKTLGVGTSVSSVCNTRRAKVVTIEASTQRLAKGPNRKSRPRQPSVQTRLDGNSAETALSKAPHIRRCGSAISVSESGSPLRRGIDQPILESDPENPNSTSKQQLKVTSDIQSSLVDTSNPPSAPFLLSLGKPSSLFHRLTNVSSRRQPLSLPPLSQQLDRSPSSWHKRPVALLQRLGLSPESQQKGGYSPFSLQTWDPLTSWPIVHATVKDLGPLASLQAGPPHNSPVTYASSYRRILVNSRPLQPATASATFTREGWNRNSDIGICGLPGSAFIHRDSDKLETPKEFKTRLISVLGQMMFVSGETAEASTETTGMIEEIVRAQVIEMLKQATELANRRGVRSISTADLIFLIRHDKAKVSRLKTFLSWKDVRKNVKDSDEKGGGDAGEVDFDDGANLPGAGPVDAKKSSNKKAKLILPWEVQSYYSEQVPERDDEEDNEEEEEQNEATLARLASADERTKNMTRDEYVYWSDCRQASFTFRKGKRFREWAGFGVVTDSKPNDDIVDILGFLTFEIVQTLTEEALKVKAAEDLHNARTSSAAGGETKKRKREGSSLFEMPEEGRTPVEPKHVREAFRRLQIVPKKYSFMRPGYMGIKQPLRLI